LGDITTENGVWTVTQFKNTQRVAKITQVRRRHVRSSASTGQDPMLKLHGPDDMVQWDTTAGAAKDVPAKKKREGGAVHHMALPTITDDMLQRVTPGFGTIV
jgi:hypothetical protein